MGNSNQSMRLPPGPKGLPFLGNLLDFRRDPLRFLTELAKEFGDVAGFRIGSKRIVQLNHPDLIRDVLVTNHRNFIKTGVLKRAEPILGNGLVASDGEFHHRQRRLMQPGLSRQRVRSYTELVAQSTHQFMAHWSDGQEIDMAQEMLHLTLDIVSKTLFSVDLENDADRIEEALTIVLEHFNHLLTKPHTKYFSKLPSAANRRFRDARQFLDGFVYQMIDERRRSPKDRGDVLSMLLSAQDVEGDGQGMTDVQIRDEVMTLLTAGHETIATALTWTWYCLTQNANVYDTLFEEIDQLPDPSQFTADDLPRFGFTGMVFAEAMRLFPPAWGITRQCLNDFQAGEFTIQAGTIIGLTQYVTQRDPRFFPDPERFDPSRWTEEAKLERPKFAYFPFGGGPRLCIGEPFTWMEAMIVIASIARKWAMTLIPNQSIEFQPLLTLRPKYGIRMRVERRLPASKTAIPEITLTTASDGDE